MNIKNDFYGTLKFIPWEEYIKGNYRYEETVHDYRFSTETNDGDFDVILNLDTLEYFCTKEGLK